MKQKTADVMRPIVESYALYKGSKKAFCQEHGIGIHLLDYWRRKFSGLSTRPSAFVALEVTDTSGSELQSVELHYPNGVRAIVPLKAPLELLQNLIRLGH